MKINLVVELIGDAERAYKAWHDNWGMEASAGSHLDQSPHAALMEEDIAIGFQADMAEFLNGICGYTDAHKNKDSEILVEGSMIE